MTVNRPPERIRLCLNSHENPYDSSVCHVCGLPLVDYEAEMSLFLDTLGAEESHLTFSRRMVFIGVGDQGCRLIGEFYRTSGEVLTDSEFLMIESSGEAGQATGSKTAQNHAGDRPLPHLSHHLLPASPSRRVGYFGLGEHLAAGDPRLDDRLLRAGVRPSSKVQTVFLVSALGGGTGGGATPHILRRAKALNPQSRSLVLAMMPSADEPDSAHFNAFCSLSRLLGTDAGPLADIILLTDHNRLVGMRGVSPAGEEIAREALLSHLLAALAGATDGESTDADPSYLTKMSSSIGIQVFVPCLAIGRSLEIFGSMEKILDSALSSPLAPIDSQSIALSYMLVRVPDRMAASLHEKTLRTQLNRWNRERFPRLKGSVIQLAHTSRTSDRVDLCLLLGGTRLSVTAKRAEQGFHGFKSIVRRKSWEQEFGVDSDTVAEMEKAVRDYDTKLDEMAD